MISRYRAQIRADLLERYGVDLARWWAERRFRPLLDLIDQQPYASRLNEAVVNDPEQARLIARMPPPEDEWSPSVRDWDLKASMMRELIHAVQINTMVVQQANGGRPGRFVEFPSPATEVERQMLAATREWANELISILTPGVTL